MPGTITQELLRILVAQKASGKTCAWISPQNAQAFFYGNPKQPQRLSSSRNLSLRPPSRGLSSSRNQLSNLPFPSPSL